MNRSLFATFARGSFYKLSLFALTTLLSVSASYGQAPGWAWAASAGGSGIDRGIGVAKDASGNIIVLGESASASISFGSTTLSAPGLFIVKYKADGNVLWAEAVGGEANGYKTGCIAVDGNDNIYVTGAFTSTLTIGGTTLTNAGGLDFFVAKFDSSGNPVWCVSAGGTMYDVSTNIAVDANDNVYVTGSFGSPTIAFGSTTFNNSSTNGGGDFFLVKYAPSGSVLWALKGDGIGADGSNSVATDRSGNVFITGSFKGILNIGTATLASVADYDFFICKYDSSGLFQWANRAGTSDNDRGAVVATDTAGNVFATGYLGYPSGWPLHVSFGNINFTPYNRGFLVKYDAAGVTKWVTNISGYWAMAVDEPGNIYVAGTFYSPTLIVGPDTLVNKSQPIPGGGHTDAYIAKYSRAGKPLWGISAGSSLSDGVGAIGIGDTGRVYITGSYTSQSMGFDTLAINSTGSVSEFYVAQTGPACFGVPVQPALIYGKTAPCIGSAELYNVDPDLNADLYNWTLPSGWSGASIGDSITAQVGAQGGLISVQAVNQCGVSSVQTFAATPVPSPPTTITQAGNTLQTTGLFDSYQWYINGLKIGGATSQTYVAMQSGSFYVVTSKNNCIAQSNSIHIIHTDINEIAKPALSLYPNPNNGSFTLTLPKEQQPTVIRIFNIYGQAIDKKTITSGPGSLLIEMADISPGLYYIEVIYPEQTLKTTIHRL